MKYLWDCYHSWAAMRAEEGLSACFRIPSGILEKEIKVWISLGGRSRFRLGCFVDHWSYLTTKEWEVRLIEVQEGFLVFTIHILTFCPIFAGRSVISGKVAGSWNWSVTYAGVNNMWAYISAHPSTAHSVVHNKAHFAVPENVFDTYKSRNGTVYVEF